MTKRVITSAETKSANSGLRAMKTTLTRTELRRQEEDADVQTTQIIDLDLDHPQTEVTTRLREETRESTIVLQTQEASTLSREDTEAAQTDKEVEASGPKEMGM